MANPGANAFPGANVFPGDSQRLEPGTIASTAQVYQPTLVRQVVPSKIAEGTSSNSSSGTTFALTNGASLGERVVFAVGSFGSNVTSVTDSKGNTYVEHAETTSNAGVHLWSAVVTSALVPGDTVTFAITPAARISAPVLIAVPGVGSGLPVGHGSTLVKTQAGGVTANWTTQTATAPPSAGFAIAIAVQNAGPGGSSAPTSAGWAELSDDTTAHRTTTLYKACTANEASVQAAGTWSGANTNEWSTALIIFPIATPASLLRSEVGADSPAQWWHFDDVAGTSAVESVAGVQTGTIAGSVYKGLDSILIDSGKSFQFDGVGGEVTLPGPAMPGTGSVEFWFEWAGGTSLLRDDTSAGGTGWIFGFDNGGTFAFRLGGATRNTAKTTVQVRDGRLHHVVFTWAAGTIPRCYLDGVDITTTLTSLSPSGGAPPWHVMRNGSGAASYTKGRVDELAFYTTALGAARITAHYDAGKLGSPVTPSSYLEAVAQDRPFGWWHLDDLIGTTSLADAIGGNPATMIGGGTLETPGPAAGTAITFDGINDEITIPAEAYDNAEVWSYEMVFKWSAGAALARGNSTTGGQIYGFDNGGNFAVASAGGGTAHNTTKTTAQVRDGNYHHLVVVGGNNDGHVYLDGVDITSGSWSIAGTGTAPLHIMRNGLNAAYTTGAVDEISFFGRKLTQAEALVHYQAWAQRMYPGTIASTAVVYSPALDQSGTGQDLEPGFWSETSTVYSPTLIAGQPLSPSRVDNPEPVVFEPIISANPLWPDYWENTTTVYGPSLAHGQAINPDTITDTPTVYNPTLVRGQALNPATITGASTVFIPALERHQVMVVASVIDASVNLVLEPEVTQPPKLMPERVENTTTVYSPALVPGVELEPSRVDNPAPTVYNPALRPGTPINPAVWTSPSGSVRSPRLIQGKKINPDFWTKPPTTVFSPRLVAGQPLRPTRVDNGATTVFSPRLIPGQFLRPDFWTKPAATIYSPSLAHGQPIYPALLTNSTGTVYAPRLIPAQLLYVGAPNAPGTPTVYEPAMVIVPPVVIDPDDPEGASEASWVAAVRSGR